MSNAMALSFADTRSRRTDSATSREAARYSASQKACQERLSILIAVTQQPMTAREISAETGIDYIEVQRRISEVAGIEKSGERRDGCMVWRALSFASPVAETNSPLVIEQSCATGERQPMPTASVGDGLRSAGLPLDETIDYFSAQGAIDRWKALAE